MNHKLKSLAASAAIAFAFTAGPAAAQDNVFPQCLGMPFNGEYIIEPNPTVAPLTVEQFNDAAGKNIVQSLSPLSSLFFIVTPTDPAPACEEFMADLKDTGLIKNIAPNSIISLGPLPGPQ